MICMNDRLAFGAYQALAEAGLGIPQDDVGDLRSTTMRSPPGSVQACPPRPCRTSRWAVGPSNCCWTGSADQPVSGTDAAAPTWLRRSTRGSHDGAVGRLGPRSGAKPIHLVAFRHAPARGPLGLGQLARPGRRADCATCSSCGPRAPCSTQTAAIIAPALDMPSRPTCGPGAWSLTRSCPLMSRAGTTSQPGPEASCADQTTGGTASTPASAGPNKGLVQRIGLATSDDLLVWHRRGTRPAPRARSALVRNPRPDAVVRAGVA